MVSLRKHIFFKKVILLDHENWTKNLDDIYHVYTGKQTTKFKQKNALFFE